MPTPPSPIQYAAVVLAFAAAGVSFLVLGYSIVTTGRIQATPLFGGLLMLALGIGGLKKLKPR
jgi:hypothetical protein